MELRQNRMTFAISVVYDDHRRCSRGGEALMNRSGLLLVRLCALAILFGFFPRLAVVRSAPHLADSDRIRLREAFRLADQLEEQVWPGWKQAPFAVPLVTPDYEFLVRHPQPSGEFTKLGSDALLGSDVYFRKRQFPVQMQATFPAVNGLNTVVIGQAELTADKTSSRWVITVMHEHFHQFVNTRPGYIGGMDALDLAHGDNTGMWMLNFPFPYDSPEVQEKFVAMNRALADALASPDGADLQEKSKAYQRARQAFREALPVDAERYFAFQLWQEGVARYTELRLADLAAAKYTPTPEFSQLPDFKPFAEIAGAIRQRILDDIHFPSLAKSRRTVVYSVGAAEAMLLDRVRPNWQGSYFQWMSLLPALQKMFRLPE